VRNLGAVVRIRFMSARFFRTTSRIAFFLCGLISLFTGVPFLMLRGAELPVQNEWVIFVAALALVGVFSVALALLPRSWIAKGCNKDPEDKQLFLAPLQWLAAFAAISYFLALVAYLAPQSWNLNPHDVFAVPVVFREDALRSLARDDIFPARSHECRSVRFPRTHLRIPMVGLP
jgi:uncharacterized membrane protein YhaH (DUF805 family)